MNLNTCQLPLELLLAGNLWAVNSMNLAAEHRKFHQIIDDHRLQPITDYHR